MIVTVDGRRIELADGATVLDAVNRLGIPLPQLCKDPDRAPLGACRTCLVHVEGQRGTPAACHLPARDGMVVDTQHPEVVRVRSTVLDLTLSMLTPAGERAGDRNGFGQLGVAAARHGRLEPSWAALHAYEEDASKSFFVLDRDACILCGRCAVACDDVQQIGAIALLGRNHATKVGVFGDGPMASSVCTSCGQCVATCPTGALRPKDTPGKIARAVETTCPYCGVGCGIELKVRDDGRLAIMADDVPANHSSLGMLCVKGRFATGFVHARDRVTRPMVKRDGRWHEVGWDEALDATAEGLARHHGHFGALASAKATNEDGYLVQKFCRVVMATNDVDHCTRLCHSPSVEAMLASMGSGATSNSYQDYEEAGCLMVVGADASANHPVIAAWLTTTELIRNFTTAVSNIADDSTPAKQLVALRPAAAFTITSRGGKSYIDPQSYSRYNRVADALASVDPAGAARLYTTLKPRIEEAAGELGHPPGTFDRVLERAIVALLRTPIPEPPIEVIPYAEGIGYGFVDDRLEAVRGFIVANFDRRAGARHQGGASKRDAGAPFS